MLGSALVKAKEITVVVPCFNEEANVPELAARMGEVFAVGQLDGELVLVDDLPRTASGKVRAP